MVSGGALSGRGPARLVYERPRTRVTRVVVSGRAVINKEPLGPDAERRVRHELAVLRRLRGLAGVAQLAHEPQSAQKVSAWPGSVVLVDAGVVSLAEVSKPVEDPVGMALGLAQAVAGMHTRGVMHRNICPANIVLDGDGSPCLVDFGLATAGSEIRPEFTHHSQIVGELAYLAPEQTGRTGRSVDERADLYALGATLYELATGAPPFGSGDPLRLLHDHLTRLPVPPVVVSPAVPGPLSEIIVHLLEKEPDRRYQSADGLIHDLQRLHDAAGGRAGADFRVGARDVPLRLVPPSRLVGRDEQIAELEAAFDDALAGHCRGVLVAGRPGVGKTAMVDQLRSVVTGRDGWFISGKFDQYRRDLEFDGVGQAIRALGRLLLAEPEEALAEARERILRALGPTAAQRAAAAAVQVHSLTNRNRFAEAITLGVETLRELGIAAPPADPFGADLDRQFGYLYRWLERPEAADDLDRPEISDPVLLATTRLINAVLPAAYFAGELAVVGWLSLEAVRIWLVHGPAATLIGSAGQAAVAAVALRAAYAVCHRALRRILAVGEARGYEPGTSQARFLFAMQTWRFGPIEEGVDAARRAREGLIAGGDLAYAAYCYHPTVYYLLDCAPTLNAVAAEAQAGLAFARRTGNDQTGQWLDGYRWLVEALRGEGSAAVQPIPVETYAGNPLVLFHSHLTRAVHAAVVGDAAGLARHTAAAMPLVRTNDPAAHPFAVIRLLRGVSLAGQARTADGDERNRLLAELDELTAWLAARAADAPANYGHLVRLLEAERAWAVGDLPMAALAFDTALREVADRQRPWHRGLTAERTARFFLAQGLDHIGYHLLAEARQAYAGWGATAKVAQLDWAYPTLRPTAVTITGHGHDHPADLPTKGAPEPAILTSGTIDLLGILSASQAISSETNIDRLHTRVADVLGAMTGATRVRLFVYSDEHREWLTPGPVGATLIGSGHETSAPMTVLRYVHRTGEPLIVADTAADDRFARDPYLTDAGCSLLAVPILSRGTLRAVLLLENRLIRGAFSTGRLDAVTLVAAQLAVSLDNAQLYADLTASRQRIVTTADHTRRRIERDLHDGAQQRLVSLTMQLNAARAERDPDQHDALLGCAAAEAAAAMEELREIAHGIHPSVLTTGGLRPALRALARRAPIPVEVRFRVDRRLPEPVEISAYYTVAEALTNIAKHAQATMATVTVEATDTILHLTIHDDGIGGADFARGTGMLGLKDRVEALGGHITLDSPPGEGTALHAQIPLTTARSTVD